MVVLCATAAFLGLAMTTTAGSTATGVVDATAAQAHVAVLRRQMQELTQEQLKILMSLLDDDKNGKINVHEMIDAVSYTHLTLPTIRLV